VSETSRAPDDVATDHTRIPRAVIVLLAVAGLTITLAGVRSVSGIIGPTFLALLLVVTVHPIRAWLESKGVPKWIASIVTVVLTYLIIIVLTLALVVAVGRMAAIVPQYSDRIDNLVTDVGGWLQKRGVGQDQVDSVVNSLDVGKLVGYATGILSAALNVLTNLLFIALLLIFMTSDTPGIVKALKGAKLARPDLVSAIENFAQGSRSYMAVSALFGLIVAVINWIGLAAIGVPGAFVWAVLSFVTNFIPNLGFIIGLVPPAVIGLLQGGLKEMIIVIALYVVANFIVQSVIQPRFIGDAVGLSTTLTFLSLAFWAWALGALGALLAVPLSLLVRSLLVEADPDARWLLPLISGRPQEIERPDVSATESADEDEDATTA
jgi:predicted PurR-regulated permease PerM